MTTESDINVVLAHLQHLKEDLAALKTQMNGINTQMVSVKDEIVCLKLELKEKYIPRASCVEIQKKCHEKMNNSVTKDEFSPIRKVVFFFIFLLLAAVAKATLQGVTLQWDEIPNG